MDVMKLLEDLKSSFADIDEKIAAFSSQDWFKDYPPAVKALTDGTQSEQLAALQTALAQGAEPEAVAPDGTTAVKLALGQGHLAAIKALHDAGATFAERNWTPLHCAVLFGTPADVAALANPETCAETDLRDWSPLLLACALGQTEAAQILWPLTPAEARQVQTGDGENALILAATYANASLVEWLLQQGVRVDWPDHYGGTALLAAIGTGSHTLVESLLKRGANPNPQQNISASLRDHPPKPHFAGGIADQIMEATLAVMPASDDLNDHDTMTGALDYQVDAEMVRLLVAYGFPLDQVNDEWLPTAIGADLIPDPLASATDLVSDGSARAGASNPEQVAPPFWISQIRSGLSGYSAADAILNERRDHPNPVWSFQRFGRSITRLPDGRIVVVAGEHEDFYDADFCIYADVTVLDGKGGVEHFIYPATDFPPTDFHTATLVGDTIWLIGNTGYQGARSAKAQVLALSTKDWSIRRIATKGDDPGWISKHKATFDAGCITVWDTKAPPDFLRQSGYWSLELSSLTWRHEGRA